FVVQHVRDIGGGCEDVKLIGVYASEEDASDAVTALRTQPGFQDHDDGFSIDAHKLGRIQWADGFFTTPNESASPAAANADDLAALFRTLGTRSIGRRRNLQRVSRSFIASCSSVRHGARRRRWRHEL